MEKESKTTSLSQPLLALFVIVLSLTLMVGGLITLFKSLFQHYHHYFESVMLLGMGITLMAVIFLIVLFSKSIVQVTALVNEIDRASRIEVAKLTAQSPAGQDVLNIRIKSIHSDLKTKGTWSLEMLSDEKLASELQKALAEEDYEKAEKIKEEQLKRKK